VLAKYFKRSDPNFLDETYSLVTKFTEKTPRVDARNVSTVLELNPSKASTLKPLPLKSSIMAWSINSRRRALRKSFC
jgi:hypothetical protein